MAIKFSQFNLRVSHNATTYLVGYDGNQNIQIKAADLLQDVIDGTEHYLPVFGSTGYNIIDSIAYQDAGATQLTIGGQLNVDAAATFDTSITVTGDSTLNGNVTLGDTSADLITQTGTLYLNGPIKDTTDTLGATDQILVSDASGELTFTDLADISAGAAEVVEVPVKNLQGSPLTKGDPVFISGSVGTSGRLEVKLADASNAAKMPALGLLKQDLAINEEGFVVVTGKLRNLTTDPIGGATPLPNDVIYVKGGGTTGNALTLTKPTGTDLIQNMGKVGRVSTANDGTFVVSSILRTNDIPNLTQGKIWVGSSGNTIESATVHLDEATNRLGINNVLPSETLDVDGTLRSTSFAYFSTDGPTSFVDIGSTSTTLSQLNLITTSAGSETSIIQGSRVLRLRVDNTDTKSILLNNSGEVSLAAYGGGTITGTAAYSLSVDANGNIIETTTIPSTFVESVATTDGTYINLTPNSATNGAVTITADLSAIDGSSDTTTRFLSKDNTWDIPSYTTVTTTDGTYINLTPNSATSGAVTVTADLSAVDGVAAVGERYLTKNNTWAEVATIPGTYTFDVSDGTASTTINSGDTLGILGGTYITTSNTTGNVTISHNATSRTDTTSADTPGYGGTFTVVDSVTTNATGHLEAINVKTVTMPSADDTNTTYDLSGYGTSNGTAGVQLVGSDSTTDQVAITGAGTTSVVHASNTITITSNDQYTGTVTSVLGGTYITDTGTATDPVLNHDTTSRSDTTSTASPSHGGTFTTIDSVTSNATGHITAVNLKTVTLPSDANTTSLPVKNSTGTTQFTSTDTTGIRFQGSGTTTVSFTPGTQLVDISSADQYTGTVTQINTAGPISGGTITTSGTISITKADGTTDGYLSSTDWNTFNNKTSNTGTVTSVGLSMPAAFSVANSPITSSGTLTVTGAGTTAQYIRGDGTLATFPTIPPAYGDSDVDAHLNTSTATTNQVLSWSGTDYDWVTSSSSNDYVNAASFNTGDGILTLTRTDTGTVTVDLDGRFLTGNQTITLSGDVTGSGTTSIITNISSNVVGANELNVSGNGTSGQVLTSDGDGTFSWSTPATGGITGVTAGTGLSGGGTSGTVTLNLDFSELTDKTTDISGTTEFILQDGTTESRKAASEIKLSNFNNDSGWTSNVGDITGVTAGNGLTGGGTSGSVTLNVGAGTGITVNANDIALATAGVGAGTYGSTADDTKIDTITVDAYGRITAVATGPTGDITGVTAGAGLSGGGTAGTVSLVNADRGSSQNIFKNFAVSGQSTVVADNNNDTLTLIAGSNVSITTNATNDSITINATDTNTNNYVSSASFNTGDGVLTLNRSGLSAVTVDLDGRYLTSYSETDTLATVVARGSSTTSRITTGGLTVTSDIRGNGQQLVLNAGESSSYATGQTNELVYINAETGLEINSSPDNWASGWAGRKTATINNASGHSSFPGNVNAASFLDASNTSYYVDPANTGTAARLNGDALLSDGKGFGIVTSFGTPELTNFYGALATNAALYVGGGTSTTTDLYSGYSRASIFYNRANSAYYMDGDNTGDSIRVAGDIVAYYSSDKRLKDNIKPIENALDKVNAISGVTFEWNEKSHKTTGRKDVGVIAQEVEEVFPEIVETRSNGYKAVDYQKLTAVLIESVKELTAKVEALESKQCK